MDTTLFELLKTTQDVGLRETLENKIKHLEKILLTQNAILDIYNQIEFEFIEPTKDFEPDYFDQLLTNTKIEIDLCCQLYFNFFEYQ